jgi:hypothetical protein
VCWSAIIVFRCGCFRDVSCVATSGVGCVLYLITLIIQMVSYNLKIRHYVFSPSSRTFLLDSIIILSILFSNQN